MHLSVSYLTAEASSAAAEALVEGLHRAFDVRTALWWYLIQLQGYYDLSCSQLGQMVLHSHICAPGVSPVRSCLLAAASLMTQNSCNNVSRQSVALSCPQYVDAMRAGKTTLDPGSLQSAIAKQHQNQHAQHGAQDFQLNDTQVQHSCIFDVESDLPLTFALDNPLSSQPASKPRLSWIKHMLQFMEFRV